MDPALLTAWRESLASWDARLLTFALVVMVPSLGYVRFHRWLASVDSVVPTHTKLRLYGTTVCSQWFFVAVMLLVARRHGLSVADVGERFEGAPLTMRVTLGLLLILAVVSAIVLWRVRRASPESLATAGGRMRQLMPASGLEMAAFAGVCVTAGVCEELLYRGWMVNMLLASTGSTWVAVVVSSIVFGIGHAYQGSLGMLRTMFVGLQLAALFVVIGSLIPGQALHAGVDLLAGAAGAFAVSRTDFQNRANSDAAIAGER